MGTAFSFQQLFGRLHGIKTVSDGRKVRSDNDYLPRHQSKSSTPISQDAAFSKTNHSDISGRFYFLCSSCSLSISRNFSVSH